MFPQYLLKFPIFLRQNFGRKSKKITYSAKVHQFCGSQKFSLICLCQKLSSRGWGDELERSKIFFLFSFGEFLSELTFFCKFGFSCWKEVFWTLNDCTSRKRYRQDYEYLSKCIIGLRPTSDVDIWWDTCLGKFLFVVVRFIARSIMSPVLLAETGMWLLGWEVFWVGTTHNQQLTFLKNFT